MFLFNTTQFNILEFSELKIKTSLFSLDQKQKTKAYFHVGFELRCERAYVTES